MKIIKLAIVAMAVSNLDAYTQSLPVGTPGFDDLYRREQLSGNTDSSFSFTVRPTFPENIKIGSADSAELRSRFRYGNSTYRFENNLIDFSVLPFSIQSQFNSHHPVDWNDGAMIPAKGVQAVLSGGFFAKMGPLSIQLRPEIVTVQNSHFETFNQNHYDVNFARYYDIYNNIDLPARFGTGRYNKVLWGQSSIRLNYKSLSIGFSNENLWWGPGIRNSLLMSNTSPGFKHLTFNTLRPLKTPVGSFEGQLIAGRLENTEFGPLTPDHFYFGSNLYVPKPNNWRYLSGIVLTWQPKWVPGLFLGFDRTSQMYGKDLNKFGDYFPFFSTFSNASSADVPIGRRDELSSMFMRWVWPEERAEVYFQYGRYNSKPDITQAILTPNHSRAYIWGLRKMVPFNRLRKENLLIGIEVTQLQQTSPEKIAKGTQWYVSQSVKHGYTHMGQMLGAGIGPGANSQTLTVSWVKGLKRIGFQLERYVHNNDLYYYMFTDSRDYRRHWVDMNFGLSGEWDVKNFIFNLRLQRTKSLNYQWYLKDNPSAGYFVNGLDADNIQVLTGITYKF